MGESPDLRVRAARRGDVADPHGPVLQGDQVAQEVEVRLGELRGAHESTCVPVRASRTVGFESVVMSPRCPTGPDLPQGREPLGTVPKGPVPGARPHGQMNKRPRGAGAF